MLVQPGDHPKIQQADRTIRQYDQISGMRVTMIKAMVKNHVEIHFRAVLRYNNADIYAASVGYLAERLSGRLKRIVKVPSPWWTALTLSI